MEIPLQFVATLKNAQFVVACTTEIGYLIMTMTLALVLLVGGIGFLVIRKTN